jgi:phage baseplate assembly protein W
MSSTRLGISTNLAQGGLNDLLLIKYGDGFPEGLLDFDIDDTPRKVTGIQKVAQMFVKILFTSLGSNVLSPNQGTNFPTLTVNANITEDDSVFMADLVTEIRSAESQVKRILNIGTDVASQLDSVTILGLDTGSESVTIYLRILTKAGAKAQVAIPFPQLDLKLNGD